MQAFTILKSDYKDFPTVFRHKEKLNNKATCIKIA